MKTILAAFAGVLLFAAVTFAKHKYPRMVYDTPSQILSGFSPEIVMTEPAKAATTYRFSASIETTPGEGCEYDTMLYFVRTYIGTTGASGGQRQEIRIHKRGATVTSVAEIPASTFQVKAGSRISYHVEYLIGGRCTTRPTYHIFPVLEQIGGNPE